MLKKIFTYIIAVIGGIITAIVAGAAIGRVSYRSRVPGTNDIDRKYGEKSKNAENSIDRGIRRIENSQKRIESSKKRIDDIERDLSRAKEILSGARDRIKD